MVGGFQLYFFRQGNRSNHSMIRQLILVGAGSAIGGMLRFGIGKWMYGLYPHPFPYPTLIINIVGSFLIGLFYGLTMKTTSVSPAMALFLTSGICGGFTTFSAFSYENIVLLKNGNYGYALAYVVLSVLTGIFSTFLGTQIIK